ncbi:hypothetical protein BJ973_002507 [Actinoplanes tereljensis]|uniref:hypothetical protein n=1 Tax=Paractinoplanes tereljensis TaxID=571912 RepID=UPI0019408B78|nr:hypothetical protein [Actinoplanes tereljensis]
MERSTSETPAPLEEARRKPIDRIDRATSALIVHRVTRRDRPEVTPAFQSSV